MLEPVLESNEEVQKVDSETNDSKESHINLNAKLVVARRMTQNFNKAEVIDSKIVDN